MIQNLCQGAGNRPFVAIDSRYSPKENCTVLHQPDNPCPTARGRQIARFDRSKQDGDARQMRQQKSHSFLSSIAQSSASLTTNAIQRDELTSSEGGLEYFEAIFEIILEWKPGD
jgi:hypothetical protein